MSHASSTVYEMDGFTSATAKTQRAHTLLTELTSVSDDWTSEVRVVPEVQIEETEEGRSLIVHASGMPSVPVAYSLLLDDYLHHLRSALDHAIWQLVLDNGQTPTRNNMFPVQLERKEPELGRALMGTDPAVMQVVESFQPYTRPEEATYSALWILHHLNRIAKHRSIVPTVTVHESIVLRVPDGLKGIRATITATAAGIAANSEIVRYKNIPPGFTTQTSPVALGAPRLWIGVTDQSDHFPVSDLDLLADKAIAILAGLRGCRST